MSLPIHSVFLPPLIIHLRLPGSFLLSMLPSLSCSMYVPCYLRPSLSPPVRAGPCIKTFSLLSPSLSLSLALPHVPRRRKGKKKPSTFVARPSSSTHPHFQPNPADTQSPLRRACPTQGSCQCSSRRAAYTETSQVSQGWEGRWGGGERCDGNVRRGPSRGCRAGGKREGESRQECQCTCHFWGKKDERRHAAEVDKRRKTTTRTRTTPASLLGAGRKTREELSSPPRTARRPDGCRRRRFDSEAQSRTDRGAYGSWSGGRKSARPRRQWKSQRTPDDAVASHPSVFASASIMLMTEADCSSANQQSCPPQELWRAQGRGRETWAIQPMRVVRR